MGVRWAGLALLCWSLHCVAGYSWVEGETDEPAPCPGLYCGRLDRGENYTGPRYGVCGGCPRGWRVYRPGQDPICRQCHMPPALYDWLYLGFVTITTLQAHWVAIDYTAKCRQFTRPVLALHCSALLEVAVAALATLLLSPPVGSLRLTSCGVVRLADWYTLLYNPRPNYQQTLHCTQEAVYPLYSMVFVFYAFCLVTMLLVRPCLASKLLPGRGRNAVYAALYFLPLFALGHGVLGGVVYYSYPYILILASLVSCAAHYAFKLDQSLRSLVVTSLTESRNLVILLGHWALHAYGIVAVTELKEPRLHLSLISLVPLPALFYVLTARFTDPARITGGTEIG